MHMHNVLLIPQPLQAKKGSPRGEGNRKGNASRPKYQEAQPSKPKTDSMASFLTLILALFKHDPCQKTNRYFERS